MVEFNFDLPSFGVGAAAGVAATIAGQRAWQFAKNIGEGGEKPVTKTYAAQEIDRGYLQALVELAQGSHLFGHKARLSDILIEPRFIRAPELASLPDEDDPNVKIFDTVPRVYDYPHIYAPYNLPTISVEDIGRGTNKLILIGTAGSGRTTALLSIALWSSGFLEFTSPVDSIQKELDSEESKLSARDRADRVKNRVALVERARAQYNEVQTDKDSAEKETKETVEATGVSRIRELAPLYIHLSNVIIGSGEYGLRVDPTEPLVRGVQQNTEWLTSKRIARNAYKLLESGSALVLIDGFDDLPQADRPAALRWIKALYENYGNNFFITAMSPYGYGPLMESGGVPIILKPWNDQLNLDYIQQFARNWDKFETEPIFIDEDEYASVDEFAEDIYHEARGLTALETTLYAWLRLKNQTSSLGGQIHQYLTYLLPNIDHILPELIEMASIQLDDGYITHARLVASALEQELGITLDDSELEASGGKKENKEQRGISAAKSQLLKALLEAGIIKQYRSGRYQFRQIEFAGYLAALGLVEEDSFVVLAKYENPDWAIAIQYLAEQRDIDFIVVEQLGKTPDLLYSSLSTLSSWLRFSGTEVSWRNNLLKHFGNMMIAPNQFTLIRERIAAALLHSHDKGSVVVFRRALRNANPEIRRIGCFGVGYLRDGQALDALTNILTQDPIAEVQIAATLALAAINTRESLRTLVDSMEMAGDNDVRRTIAESLAADRKRGYATLYDALRTSDMMMRRAAVFGVGRIRTDWALLAINETFLEDKEWFVRSAAQVVFQDIYEAGLKGVNAYPPLHQAPWLIEWVAEQKEMGNISSKMTNEQAFELALSQREDLLIKLLAIQSIGYAGQQNMLDKVYQALQDRNEVIRDVAYRALGDLQVKLGISLPTPLLV